MGPFPHDAPRATISEKNPAGTDGFEFVEFAHPEPQELRDVFTKMGFSHTANHKTQNVELWQQGDVSYLINMEPGSQAEKFSESMDRARLQWAGALWMPSMPLIMR